MLRYLQRFACITYGAACHVSADSGNAGYVFCSIFLINIIPYFVAPPAVYIEVDIWRLVSQGMHETLEEQIVVDGVGYAYIESVDHQAVHGAAACLAPD